MPLSFSRKSVPNCKISILPPSILPFLSSDRELNGREGAAGGGGGEKTHKVERLATGLPCVCQEWLIHPESPNILQLGTEFLLKLSGMSGCYSNSTFLS